MFIDMGITESLRKLAEQAAEKALAEGSDVVSIPTAGNLVLVKSDSDAGRARQAQPGAVAEIITFNQKEFYICNW